MVIFYILFKGFLIVKKNGPILIDIIVVVLNWYDCYGSERQNDKHSKNTEISAYEQANSQNDRNFTRITL